MVCATHFERNSYNQIPCLPEMSMFIKKMSFFFQSFDQIKFVIDVILASAFNNHVALL